MNAYYNEIDEYAAQWLRNLISRNLIAQGDVDERSITDVQADDLRGYTQCHFFAGIGGWSAAARLAGWPDERPLWTGSCPCQPFSVAGKRRGEDDERHLWPEFARLIGQRCPPAVFGEQVASKDGRTWLATVRSDLEAMGYAVGGADLCAAGVGAPHIRQRLWWVGDALGEGLERHAWDVDHGSEPGRLDAQPGGSAAEAGGAGGLANTNCGGRNEAWRSLGAPRDDGPIGNDGDAPRQSAAGPPNGQWGDADWLLCRDGKWRPVRPGTFPLGHGLPARVGRLRAYGNAIVPQVAAEFMMAAMECRP